MAVDYGTDLLALDDLPDPEQIADQDLNVAYALARRLCQPADALAETGDTAPYDCFDIREYFGQRFSLTDRTILDGIQQRARSVLGRDLRVASVSVTTTFTAGRLALSVQGLGANGPFAFVLQTNGVTAQLLRGS